MLPSGDQARLLIQPRWPDRTIDRTCKIGATRVGLGSSASVGSRAVVTAPLAAATRVGTSGNVELVRHPMKAKVNSASVLATVRIDCSFSLQNCNAPNAFALNNGCWVPSEHGALLSS